MNTLRLLKHFCLTYCRLLKSDHIILNMLAKHLDCTYVSHCCTTSNNGGDAEIDHISINHCRSIKKKTMTAEISFTGQPVTVDQLMQWIWICRNSAESVKLISSTLVHRNFVMLSYFFKNKHSTRDPYAARSLTCTRRFFSLSHHSLKLTLISF